MVIFHSYVSSPEGITTMNSSSSGPGPVVPQVAVTLKHFDANSLEGGAEADQGYDRHDFSATISKYLLADRCTAPGDLFTMVYWLWLYP